MFCVCELLLYQIDCLQHLEHVKVHLDAACMLECSVFIPFTFFHCKDLVIYLSGKFLV
jgi:hypothetical protein